MEASLSTILNKKDTSLLVKTIGTLENLKV